MSSADIRKASAEHFHSAKLGIAEVSETTPKTISDQVKIFAHGLGGRAEFVPVLKDKHGLYGWCSDGVQDKIATDAGTIAFGWTIWEWPGVLLTGEFHAIWKNDRGQLFDITPKPGGEQTIVFVHDPSCPADFNFDDRPRNHRMRTHMPPDVNDGLRAIRARLTASQLQYEEKRATKAQLSLDEWLKRKLPRDALADTMDELISLCDAFDEHFDSLGVQGEVVVDEKFRALGLRRMQTQNRLRSLLKVGR